MTKGKTLAEFRTIHDRKFIVAQRVQAALKTLGDSWEYQGEFIHRCKISPNEWGLVSQTIPEHLVATPSQNARNTRRGIVAGTKAFAAKLRAQLKGSST